MRSRMLKHFLARNFALAALLPLLLLSGVVLVHLGAATKSDAEKKIVLMAQSVDSQMEVMLHEPLFALQSIAALLRANSSWDETVVRRVLDLHVGNSPLIESIVLLDNSGVVVNAGLSPERESFRQDYLGMSLSHLPHYTKMLLAGQPTWSDTFHSVMSGNISLALLVPVEGRALMGTISLASLSEFVQGLSAEKSFQVALVDRKGSFIVHPDPLIGGSRVSVNNLTLIIRGLGGKEETASYSFEGKRYIGTVKKVAGPEWLVLVSQGAEETYRAVSSTAVFFLIGSLLAVLLGIFFALVKSRKIIAPLDEVVGHARRIAAGDYTVAISPSPYREITDLNESIRNMADAVQAREQQLQVSEKRFREIYNATSEAIFIREAQSLALIEANLAMEALFGYSQAELKECTIGQLSAGDQETAMEKARQMVWRALREGPQVLEWNYRRKSGEAFWAEVTLKAVEIDGEQRLLGVIRDITERMSLERQLAQAQKMEAIGTLAGGIAHDFNNILTPIQGYIQMAQLHLHEPARLKEDIDEVLRAVQRATDLVRQILAFSRQDSQQIAPTDIVVIVKEAMKLLRATIPATIEIRQHIDPHCGWVMANPTQIHQVLINLCTNAFHAMREKGGVLSVSLVPALPATESDTVIKKLPPGEYLRLEVSDTGHGMDKATLTRIMEPYFTTKNKEEGTGLGLSVVHGIVKGLGGEVAVASEVGRGSTFQVFLPVIEGRGGDPSAVGQQEPLVGGTGTILVVDDEESILRVMREMLTGIGYQVKVCADPEEALRLFAGHDRPCELVITDMTMPKMTGDLLAGKILEAHPSLPVILCTGFSDKIDREKALAKGVSEFFTKPVEFSKLARAIRRLLDKQKITEK